MKGVEIKDTPRRGFFLRLEASGQVSGEQGCVRRGLSEEEQAVKSWQAVPGTEHVKKPLENREHMCLGETKEIQCSWILVSGGGWGES